MTVYKAEIKGTFINDFSGKAVVASVYSKAVNILLPSGLLISIVRSKDELSALSVLVPELFSADTAVSGLLKPGMDVNITTSTISIGNIAINFGNAQMWEGLIKPEGYKLEARIKTLLEEALIKYGKRGGLFGVIDSNSSLNIFEKKALDVLIKALESSSPECASGSPFLYGISGLVGLGAGFTPSGDDFISGAILGEELAVKTLSSVETEGNKVPSIDRMSIERTLKKTSYGGRTLLWQILRNRFPFYMVKFAGSLLTNDPREITASVSRTVSHGETSGTDFLTGFLWYFKNVFHNDSSIV
ncbi:MAG: DUF2877 domain-containing protein [Spirochaetales bacterium]|nr:DUF2877 domain-containing protein [Spirochaetales bacterium]